jgi:hypothetical protein
MLVLFDSDKVGMALGLLVFLSIILMGIHGNVAAATVIARALVGFTLAYFCGFTLSRIITNALVGALATERARRRAEQIQKAKQPPEEGEETEEESGPP